MLYLKEERGRKCEKLPKCCAKPQPRCVDEKRTSIKSMHFSEKLPVLVMSWESCDSYAIKFVGSLQYFVIHLHFGYLQHYGIGLLCGSCALGT